MSEKSAKPSRKKKPAGPELLGVGFDNDDGHKRVTRGEKFILIGGSEKTHERMTETTVKTYEELKRRDKQVQTIDPRELAEIMHKADPG